MGVQISKTGYNLSAIYISLHQMFDSAQAKKQEVIGKVIEAAHKALEYLTTLKAALTKQIASGVTVITLSKDLTDKIPKAILEENGLTDKTTYTAAEAEARVQIIDENHKQKGQAISLDFTKLSQLQKESSEISQKSFDTIRAVDDLMKSMQKRMG